MTRVNAGPALDGFFGGREEYYSVIITLAYFAIAIIARGCAQGTKLPEPRGTVIDSCRELLKQLIAGLLQNDSADSALPLRLVLIA